MLIDCDNCGKKVKKKPSDVKKENFCDKACRAKYKRVDLECAVCRRKFTRLKCAASKTSLCSLTCTKRYTSERMTEMNIELNPDRMIPSTRKKLREARIDTESTSYKKYYGRHEHRILAEKKLGRPLKKGEVVHHMDHNIRNNDPDNLLVFKNQAAHARWHKNEIHNPELNIRSNVEQK